MRGGAWNADIVDQIAKAKGWTVTRDASGATTVNFGRSWQNIRLEQRGDARHIACDDMYQHLAKEFKDAYEGAVREKNEELVATFRKTAQRQGDRFKVVSNDEEGIVLEVIRE
jgi:hypothetical protein